MSMPTFPDNVVDIKEEQAFNMLLGSIAMEELSLSHILNAEGEKLQYILGTLPGKHSVCPTAKELLEVNRSITELLENVAHNQLLLKGKLQQVLQAKERWCPLPPPPPCCQPCCGGHGSCIFSCKKPTWCRGQRLPWELVSGYKIGVYVEGSLPASRFYLNPCNAYQITCTFWLSSSCDSPEVFSVYLVEQGTPEKKLMVCRGQSTGKNQPAYLSGTAIVAPTENHPREAPLAFILSAPQRVRVEVALMSIALL